MTKLTLEQQELLFANDCKLINLRYVTKELRRSEFEGLDSYFKNEYNKAANI